METAKLYTEEDKSRVARFVAKMTTAEICKSLAALSGAAKYHTNWNQEVNNEHIRTVMRRELAKRENDAKQ